MTTNNLNKTTELIDEERMIGHQKQLLQGVSFDQNLFEKELKKSQNLLTATGLKTLIDWVIATFSTVFADLEHKIKELFAHLFSPEATISVDQSV